MNKIGLIVATETEFKTIFENSKTLVFEQKETAPFPVFYTKINNSEIYAILSSIGGVFAGAATQHLIDKYNINLIINYGVAGALVDSFNLFETVIVDKIIDYLYDVSEIDNCKIGEHIETFKGQYMECDKDMIDFTLKNIDGIKAVTCASGPKFVSNEDEKQKINETYNAYICDMESSSIWLVAYKNNIKALFVKGISDTKKGGANEYLTLLKESCAATFNILLKIIEKL